MRYFSASDSFSVLLAAIISIGIAQDRLSAATCPCDIYAAAGTPCVAAHSTVRALYSAYNGPLYRVRRASDNQTKDIGVLTTGCFANAAAQDSFLNGTTGTISKIYDQTTNHNDLTKSPPGGWLHNGGLEANATAAKIMLNGHTVYGVYTTMNWDNDVGAVGYRNDSCKGLATGDNPESMYMVCSGKHYNEWCCFDYGNAETNNLDDGKATMECVYFGRSTQWAKGNGTGPWVEADLEDGVYHGGDPNVVTATNTPLIAEYVTAMLKDPSGNRFVLKGGDAQSGTLAPKWDGVRPSGGYSPQYKQGAIILGTGGDNSHTGEGTFFEGCITSGNPADSTDNKIQANIVAAGYGKTTSTLYEARGAIGASMFKVRYNPANANAVVSYALQDSRRVNMYIVDQRGRQIAAIVNGVVPAGRHEAVWDAKRVPAGVYICRVSIDCLEGWTGKIVIGK